MAGLYETNSSVVNEESEQGYLDQLVTQLGLTNPALVRHHMELAEEHFRNQRWDNSIGNSRKFLEAILAQSAAKLHKVKTGQDLGKRVLSTPREVRDN